MPVVVPSAAVHVIVDYRPALRARTGIGEYVHELAHALGTSKAAGEQLTLFSSSWADRFSAEAAADLPGAARVDRRVPVRLLTWAWHRAGWPPIERLAGRCDVVHSPTPLLVPATRAAQVVTVFDLHFLHAPGEVTGPAHDDFPDLVRDHVRRADHVIAGSAYAAGLVGDELGVPAARITTTPLGAPRWAAEVRAARGSTPGSAFLFVGTLEPRKNLGVLLDAYARLVTDRPDAPALLLAGRPTAAAQGWLAPARGAAAGRPSSRASATSTTRRAAGCTATPGRSSCPRSTRASACRRSRRWPAVCRWWRRPPDRCPRWSATPPCWSSRATRRRGPAL